MANFSNARNKVRKWEGGWSAGFTGSGETYKGFDRNYNKDWAGWKIIDKIPNKKQGQIFNNAALEKLVDDLYYNKYWIPSRAAEIINDDLSSFFFDFYFHKPLQAVVAASTAAKELKPGIAIADNKLTNSVIAVMNEDPAAVYKRMYQLRELHYMNKWMNKVGKNTYIYKVSQKGLLNRLYDFVKEIGEKKNNSRVWHFDFNINGPTPFF